MLPKNTAESSIGRPRIADVWHLNNREHTELRKLADLLAYYQYQQLLFLAEQGKVGVNTSSDKKGQAVQVFLNAQNEIPVSQAEIVGYQEPVLDPRQTSALKAWEVVHTPQFAHEYSRGAGTDTGFYLNGIPQYKLDRLGRPLTDSEFVEEYKKLYSFYVLQKELKFHWEVATSVANGHAVTSSMYICIKAKPFTPEEFNTFIQESLVDGSFYKSNSRGKLIETLVRLGKIVEIGFVPYEAKVLFNGDVRGYMRQSTAELEADAMRMVPTGVPEQVMIFGEIVRQFPRQSYVMIQTLLEAIVRKGQYAQAVPINRV